MEKDDGFLEVRSLLLRERGLDLSEYRPTCVMRRLAVRQRRLGTRSLADYAAVLRADPGEVDRLLDTLTINFTDFFRDPALFKLCADEIFPEMIQRKSGQVMRTLRIWSAGCATGEEPFSLAVTLEETLRKTGKKLNYRIYGTDVDKKALGISGSAAYHESRLRSLDRACRERYFIRKNDGTCKVSPSILAKVKFFPHNVIDPFPRDSRLDMIFCRNVLIFLKTSSHGTVFKNFHAQLSPGGYLVLGKVERLDAESAPCFSVVSASERVYRKIVGGLK
jgi:chemotaxis protein methyltransferase CheR